MSAYICISWFFLNGVYINTYMCMWCAYVNYGHSVNNRTVVQLPLTASHPALCCRAFIACTNLPYAFWVTMHF